MRIDRAGVPFIAAAAMPAVALLLADHLEWATPFGALAAFFAVFFRDPERQPPADPAAVLAPADGRVLVAGAAEPAVAPPGVWQHVSIFLSPLDVHVNRIPVGGSVRRIDYRPGRCLPAYRRQAGNQNEQNEIWIDHDGQSVVCRQVVGILARRIVCRVVPGAAVRAGQRFGIIKFGSRADVFMPVSAELRVAVGDVVRAGETILARLEPPDTPVQPAPSSRG